MEGKDVQVFKGNRRRRETSPTLNFAGSQPRSSFISWAGIIADNVVEFKVVLEKG